MRIIERFNTYLMCKPLPATSQSTAPLPKEGIKNLWWLIIQPGLQAIYLANFVAINTHFNGYLFHQQVLLLF